MKKKVKIGIAIGCAALAGVIACGHTLKCVRYEMKSEKLTAPVKLAFLSDVHSSFYGEGQSALVSRIDKFGADAVLFGGDLFDQHNSDGNSWILVDALAQKYPCFYAVGNHEKYKLKTDEYKQKMEEHGVRVLAGDSELIELNGQKIRICGSESVYDGTLEAAADTLDGSFSVLLHHYPADLPKVSQYDFDLVLAGHEHGGQWRLPGLINGLYAPDEGLFPKYAGGRYKRNGTEMLVSRGLYRNLSCVFLPRIFNNPELLLITLKGE